MREKKRRYVRDVHSLVLLEILRVGENDVHSPTVDYTQSADDSRG